MATGNIISAQEILDKVDSENGRIGHFIKVHVIAENGNYEEAFKEYHKFSSNLDTLNIPASRNNISSILNEYHNFRIQASNIQMRNTNIIHLLIFIIVVLVSGIIVYILIRKNKNLHVIMEEGIIKLESLKNKLTLSQKKRESKFIASDSDKFLFAILEKGGQEIFVSNDKEKAIEKLKHSFEDKIDKYITGDQLFKDLESILNKRYKGIIDNLKKDLPNLKEVDLNLFILSAFNLSTQAIAGFLEVDDVNLIYGRKKRLKNKINELSGASKERYLEFLKN